MFLTKEGLENDYSDVKKDRRVNIPWLLFQSTINAIPSLWKYCLKTPGLIDDHVYKIEKIGNLDKVSRWIYHDLNTTQKVLSKFAGVWSKKLEVSITVEDMKNYFGNLNKMTNIVKYHDFQYRLLHNKIFCNDILVHWRKVNSNLYMWRKETRYNPFTI